MTSQSARRLPLWASIVFALGFAVAISPNIIEVHGIHNDYEMLTFKNRGLLFHEWPHLFAIARPVSALFSNLPLLPAERIEDFRWTRLFSTVSVWLLGFQMMSICVRHLRTSALQALVVALSTFLVPAFIYSVLNAAAWGSHLVPVFFALVAYSLLSRSNVQVLAFGAAAVERDFRMMWLQFLGYCRLRPVWGACLLLQIAFYDFPPNALILTVFPVIVLCFSTAPATYRVLIAIRDLIFVGVNLALFALSTKLLYLPFIKLATFPTFSHSTPNGFEARVAETYSFKINTDPAQILARLEEIARVAADLWWLPQVRLHVAFAVALGAAAVLCLALSRQGKPVRTGPIAAAYRLAVAGAIALSCLVLASSTVLFAGGGFVSYRTIAVPTAIAGVLALWSVGTIVRILGRAVAPAVERTAADAALVAVALAAIAGNFQLNELTMRLARNEAAYFRHIVRDAIANHSKAVLIVDPRPFSLPEDHKLIYDRKGRSIPPYELACFSSFCLQNGAIVTVLAREASPGGALRVMTNRGGEPIPDLTCAMLTAPDLRGGLPDKAAGLLRFLRNLKPSCVTYDLAWHDLSYQPPP